MANSLKKPQARYDPGIKSDKELRESASKDVKRSGLGHGKGSEPFGITKEKEHVIVEMIRRGIPFATACAQAGVNYDTFCDWMIRGGDPKSNDKRKPEPGTEVEPYVGFVLRVRQAEADAEVAAIDALVGAYDKDWRSAQFYLSKRNPEAWGERGAAVSVDAGGSVTILLPDNGRDRDK